MNTEIPEEVKEEAPSKLRKRPLTEGPVQEFSFPGHEERFSLQVDWSYVPGEDEYVLRGIFQIPGDDLNPLLKLAKVIGVSTFVGAITRDVIVPASIEASSVAYDNVTREFSISKWVQGFLDYFHKKNK